MRYLLAVLTCLIRPLLPARYRERWPWEPPLPESSLDHASAYLHTIASVLLWGVIFVAYQQAYALKVTALLADDRASGEVGPLTWYGLVCFFSFFFTPWGILLTLYVFDSAIRLIHVLGSGEGMGSLFFAVPVWLAEKTLRGAREARMTRVYGKASEADRIAVVGEGLTVRANRPHEEWTSTHTFAYRGGLYKLRGVCEDAEGPRNCFLYRFDPWPDRETVRRVVHL